MYVKVYGTIRVFNKEKAIVGTHIKKIEKLDDVTNHLLQVFVAHAIRKKGVLTTRDLHSAAVVSQGARATGAPGQGGASMGMTPGFGAGMAASSDPVKLVFAVIKEIAKGNKFVHKSDIFNNVQHTMNQKDFNNALTVLCDNGNIYSSYDNDIFSITE